MAAYSMDLRIRVLADRDAGLATEEVATKFSVSVSWVNRLVQRRRQTGEVGPRQQQVFKKHAFAGQEDRLRALVDAQPDRTLAELREALHSSASLSSLWRALDRLQLTLKKKRYTPTNKAAPTSWRRVANGVSGCRCATCVSTSFSMNAASRPISYGATAGVTAARGCAITRRAVTGRRTRSSPLFASRGCGPPPSSMDRLIVRVSSPMSNKCWSPRCSLAMSSCSTISRSTSSRTSESPSSWWAPTSGSSRPTVPTSIRSNSPSPN